jgi:enoyl-CoA hydratase
VRAWAEKRAPAAELQPEDAPGQVRVRRFGPVGRITLDRTKQINALTLAMIVRIREALLRWERDPEIKRILIDGYGARGFCAGGDIRVVHDAARYHTDAADRLWREEYLLDALVADYRKPVVSVLDGIAMGGGIGLGGHASHRLVTERSVLAMPEVRIGISPDVGGLLLFARAPGLVGAHLALTGDQFGPGDALYLGFADAFAPSDRLGGLLGALAEGSAEEAVAAMRAPTPCAPIAEARSWIDHCYASTDVREVVTRLRAAGAAGAAAADRIESASPLAVCVALRALAEAKVLDSLPDVLAQDLRVGLRFLEASDPVEGIRAVLFDKGHRPVWSPPSLSQVEPAEVDRHFATLGYAELDVRRDLRKPPRM